MTRVQLTQCTKCSGFFTDELIIECFHHKDNTWIADLCPQCLEGWERYLDSLPPEEEE